MMQRATKTEKKAMKSAFKPERSLFGKESYAVPETEQQSQGELCGPLCSVNLMDLPLQAKSVPNRTGMPDQLKAGIESLSGMDMPDVRVHANSDKPVQLDALAYAQGHDIHLAPGQEQHLPHEAWHLVQQKQGRVRPTMQAKGVGINDDPGLEKEADRMGEKAARGMPDGSFQGSTAMHLIEARSGSSLDPAVQRQMVVQLLSADQIEKLREWIKTQISELEIKLMRSNDIDEMVEKLNGMYKSDKDKDLKGARNKAVEMLKIYKEQELARFAAISRPLNERINEPSSSSSLEAPQSSASSSSTSTTGKAPQAAASPPSTLVTGKAPQAMPSISDKKGKQETITRATKVEGSKRQEFVPLPTEFLGFSSPSRAPQQAEEPSRPKKVAPITLPQAGNFQGEPRPSASGKLVLSVLGISKKYTDLEDITNLGAKYKMHLSVKNYDDIKVSKSASREMILQTMHITVEMLGIDNTENPRFWLNEWKFKGRDLTKASRKSIRAIASRIIDRMNTVLI